MNAKALRKLSYGVYIVSSWDKGRPVGCVANSVMQVASQPAVIAVSVNHENYTNECIKACGRFAVSVLSEQSEPSIIGVFGFKSSRDNDKFDEVPRLLKCNMPVVRDSAAYLVCEVVDKVETQTHTVFFGKVLDADLLNEETPMTYAYYHEVVKGKSPKKAPTYLPEADDEEAKWVCSVCGYAYSGDVPFGELPEDYRCPVCGQLKAVFQLKTK
ncbi:flavin reductase [Acetivibrio ethanolgignens]|uniref:Flavin reductase n=1 Tax=Acetivibrio ethanolgignens TaxID=290052 RepID=A0A0V8QGI1_9FIRM|nr:flavin reductase [Acetivibrio ethanolgignens]KSV59666.1 flavin reductase [Acetivibrio ethanolgignens]